MNSDFLNKKGWDGELTHMIKIFGVNIDEADAKAIKSYLSSNYAKGRSHGARISCLTPHGVNVDIAPRTGGATPTKRPTNGRNSRDV